MGGIKIWISKEFQKIRIKREISSRMICMNIGTLFVFWPVSQNIPFYAHAIIIFIRIFDKINIDPISTHTIRREILHWIRIWDQNFISAYVRFLSRLISRSARGIIPGVVRYTFCYSISRYAYSACKFHEILRNSLFPIFRFLGLRAGFVLIRVNIYTCSFMSDRESDSWTN